MRIDIHPDAREELNEAYLYYEEIQSGLGDRFLDEYEKAMCINKYI